MAELGIPNPVVRGERVNSDIAAGLSMMVFVGLGFWGLRGRSGDSWIFPRTMIWTLAILAVMMLIKGVVKAERVNMFESRGVLKDVILFCVVVYAYMRLIPQFGYWAASPVVAFGMMVVYHPDRNLRVAIRSALIVAGTMVFLYLLFSRGFGVPLPRGTFW
jgi:hypothetical protein